MHWTGGELTPRNEVACADSIRWIQELRARILFDHGRRPAFRGPDGAHVDDQDLDYGAWHFIARRELNGPLLGYIRLSTPATGELFQSRQYLGVQRYEQLLRSEGFQVEETFEHSRLVVEHRARKLGLGVYLDALAIAAAHSLGAKAMIGTSGTKDGQDHFHERFGFRSVEGTRRYVEQYTEDVVIMFYRVADGAGEYTSCLDSALHDSALHIDPVRILSAASSVAATELAGTIRIGPAINGNTVGLIGEP